MVLLLLSDYYHLRKERITDLSEELSSIEINVLNAINAQSDFIIHEPINQEFFETGVSEYSSLNDSLSSVVANQLTSLAENDLIKSLDKSEDFLDLKSSLASYKSTFDQLAEYIRIRGYKDYGLEGEMREYAHMIEEDYGQFVDKADILMLRRHEKDFIIRREEKYILRFEYQSELIKYKLLINEQQPKEKKNEVENLINNYQNTFKELVKTEKLIGLKESSGLKSQVDQNAKLFTAKVKTLREEVTLAQESLLSELLAYYIFGIVFIILLSVAASLKLSRNMTSRLKKLSINLNKFVESDFKETTNSLESLGGDEVGELAKNIKVLEDEIVVHFGLYRSKVERRTNEILSQKEELEKKQGIIERKNKDILDSIKYAKKIQDSILPEKRFMDQLLKEYFVYYRPKDIVSGDFYWVERTEDKIYIAVADCTGHGVPGAFMSIMGHNFLNQAINEKGLNRPDQILSYMNIAISSSLGQNKTNGNKDILTKVQDGMDIVLISLDPTDNELMFSGAQRPLLIVRNGELIELKGDRFPVGGQSYGKMKRFTLQTQQLQVGDMLYMFSDGYADQFGGDKNKKFKYAKLRELLTTIAEDQMGSQKELLSEAHQLWKAKREQVDDICVVGIRI
jgi:serine phosphatase RsbU (regulator of sigma subunit)